MDTKDELVDASRQHNPYLGVVVDGTYRIEEYIGEGGMGVVFRVKHLRLGTDLAMKVCRVKFNGQPEARERFEREVRIAAQVGGRHVMAVHDLGLLECGTAYCVMELARGPSLDHVVGCEPLPLHQVVEFGSQIATGLSAVHAKGIVHRDLKPSNVMMESEQGSYVLKLIDFGIARAVLKQSMSGRIVGTPVYMSPEQCVGQPVDSRSDIYSFGVLMYEMATGRLPFDSPSAVDVMSMHVNVRPNRPSIFVPDMPAGLEALILDCLEKAPGDRVQSAGVALERLGMVSVPPANSMVRGRSDSESGAYAVTETVHDSSTTVADYQTLLDPDAREREEDAA